MSYFDEFVLASRLHIPLPGGVSVLNQRTFADALLKANAGRTVVQASAAGGGTVLEGAAATSAVEASGGTVLATTGAGAAVAGGIAGGAAVGTAILGILAIDAANERGDELARFNACVISFARAVSDLARRREPGRLVTPYPGSSRLGIALAVHVLRGMSTVERNRLFVRCVRQTDGTCVRDLVSRLGGNRTS